MSNFERKPDGGLAEQIECLEDITDGNGDEYNTELLMLLIELRSRRLLKPTPYSWVDRNVCMPFDVTTVSKFDSVDVIVTDGSTVGTSECQCGATKVPWVAFSRYGDICPDNITHWMYYPKLPHVLGDTPS